jgi:hypothetical protein
MAKLVFNVLSGEFDYIGETTGTFSGEISSIPQENSDPSASPEEVWVLNNIGTFSFSYRTLEGTTKRVTLNLS